MEGLTDSINRLSLVSSDSTAPLLLLDQQVLEGTAFAIEKGQSDGGATL